MLAKLLVLMFEPRKSLRGVALVWFLDEVKFESVAVSVLMMPFGS